VTPGAPGHGPLGGHTLGYRRIVKRLGGQGRAVVLEAADARLHRNLATKFLPENLAKDPRALARFQKEAQAALELNHANTYTIHDHREADGRPFIAKEYLESATLKHRMTGRHLEFETLLVLGIKIADALGAAQDKPNSAAAHWQADFGGV